MVKKECEWQNQESHNLQPDLSGGANGVSLNEYRADWLQRTAGVTEFA